MLTHLCQELYRLGILYDEDNIAESNTVSCDVPIEQSVPMFILRHGKPRRSTRRSTPRSLPLLLSFSDLSDDADIARLLSSPLPHKSTIQHRITIRSPPPISDIPQSLPPSPASALPVLSTSPNDTISLHDDSPSEDWTFITALRNTATPTPPF